MKAQTKQELKIVLPLLVMLMPLWGSMEWASNSYEDHHRTMTSFFVEDLQKVGISQKVIRVIKEREHWERRQVMRIYNTLQLIIMLIMMAIGVVISRLLREIRSINPVKEGKP